MQTKLNNNKNNNIMENQNAIFENGNSYGNDLTIEIVKRTAKTATIKTQTWGEKRVKVKSFENAGGGITEMISFKSWLIYASDKHDKTEAQRVFYTKAYGV